MDTGRNDLLGEIAARRRPRALRLPRPVDRAARRKFIEANRGRINELGGLTLIDEDPDYLAVAADGTFRSRTRVPRRRSRTSGPPRPRSSRPPPSSSSSTTRPTSTRRSPRPPARAPACRPSRPPRATCSRRPGSASTRRSRSAATRTRPRPTSGPPPSPSAVEVDDDELAAQRLYDLALEYQERSQRSEARLLEQFEEASDEPHREDRRPDHQRRRRRAADPDGAGEFRAEVLTEEENEWRPLKTAEELVEYYDPTDVFGDLADALAEAYPAIAPELAAFEANGDGRGAAEGTRGRSRRTTRTPTTRDAERRRLTDDEPAEDDARR